MHNYNLQCTGGAYTNTGAEQRLDGLLTGFLSTDNLYKLVGRNFGKLISVLRGTGRGVLSRAGELNTVRTAGLAHVL